MKIVVTGGAGFIGRVLVRMLAEKGHQVVSLDSFRFSDRSHLPPHANVEWVWGDTRNHELVTNLLKGTQAIFHLAAPSSFLMHEEDDIEACEFTLMGFKTVLEVAKHAGIKKVVWASTSAVYEGNDVPYVETMILHPPDSKAGCKKFCEEEAHRYSDRYGITCVAMRPYSVYGLGEHTKRGYANVISLFTWAMMGKQNPTLWGDGSQTRDYIYVDDAARGFVLAFEALMAGKIGTTEYNLGTGIETTFNEAVEIIGEELGFVPEIKYVPVPIKIYAHRLLADTAKIERELGFKPTVSVLDGIRRVITATRALPKEVQDKLINQQFYWKTLPAQR